MRFQKELKHAILTDVATQYWSFVVSYVEETSANDGVCDVIERYDLPVFVKSKAIDEMVKSHVNLYKEVKFGDSSFAEPSRCYVVPISDDDFEVCKMILGVSLKRDIIEYVKKYKKTCTTKSTSLILV